MYRAICFSRVSTEHQDLVQQSDEVLDEAIRYGFKKEECIFIEYKESAIKLDEDERAGLNDLKANIERYNTITTVFVYELSRISRRAGTVYNVRDFLIEHNIQLICIKPHFELLDRKTNKISEMAHMVFGIFVGMAESEMTLKKARMRRGVQRKKELGMHAGGQVMFGYRTVRTEDGFKYEIDTAKATIVKRIFKEYVYGNKSMRMLTRDLQDEGNFKNINFLTAVQEVYDILHRDCYCGKRKGMPPIISEQLYEESVKKRQENVLKVNHTDNMSLLKGILRDGDTGLLLSSNTAAKMYYSKRHSGVAVSMHIIEPLIWNIAVELHKQFRTKDKEKLLKELEGKAQYNMRKQFNYEMKMRDLSKQREKIEERLIKGRLSESKADQMHEELDKLEKEYKLKMSEFKKEAEDIDETINVVHKRKDITIDYNTTDKKERYDIVHAVIDKVFLKRDSKYILHITIHNKVNRNVKEIKMNSYTKRIIE